MHKLKVGIYYDLPYGGAKRLMDQIVAGLPSNYKLYKLPTLPLNNNRIKRDYQNFVTTYLHSIKLRTLIKKHKLDLLIVSHDSFFAAPSILTTSPVPTIFYCHEPTRALFESELGIDRSWPLKNQIYEQVYRFIKRKLERFNARRSTIILTNSHYTKEYIAHGYKSDAKVVYPGIDTSLFHPKENVKRGKNILVVGNDEPQKRLSLAVQAVGKIGKSIRPTLTLVCPRTSPNKNIFNLAKRHGVNLDVKVGISDQELISLYQTSKLTLITALAEPFGLSAVESIACGTPVVATNEGGVREIIEDRVNGYLTEDTKDNIARACTSILNNRKESVEMGSIGRKYAVSKFSYSKCMVEIIKAIDELVS